jgi:hypothetical protein
MRMFPTKRVWIRIGIGLAILLALALLANSFMIWRTERRLQARIDAIRAAGDPATIADLTPKPIPPDENAAYHLEQIAPRLDEFSKEHWQFLDKTPLGKAYDTALDRNEYASKEQLDAIRQILDRYPDIDAGLAAAAACNQYASLMDFNVSHQQLLQEVMEDRAQRIRALARFVNWRMEVLVQQGHTDEAVQLGIQLLKVARLSNSEPLLINYLVGVAIRGIANRAIYEAVSAGNVSPETLTTLDEELTRLDDPQELARALKTEQAFGISYISESGVFQGESTSPILIKLLGWPMKSMFVDSLGVFDDLFPLTKEQWFEFRDRLTPDGRLDASAYGTMGELWMPGLLAAYSSHSRNLANIRSIRIVSALARYRQEHGREASGLDELALPKRMTTDPFSGQPLKLKYTTDGWLIYTVMQNGIDDGGDYDGEEGKDDQGLAPRTRRATE